MSIGWPIVEFAAQLLERDEREAVLGDLVELGTGALQGLRDVLGLVVRRELIPWESWRPWLAAFGMALPGSLLLMGFSVSVSESCQHLFGSKVHSGTGLTLGPDFALLLCNVLLLLGWSWTGGFVMGTISRRTVRVSAVLSFLPCVFCLARFRVESMSRFCLLLFLLPAIWGVRRSLQMAHIPLRSALLFAVAITLLTVPAWSNNWGAWIANCALSWPVWYLVAIARKRTAQDQSS